MDVIKETNGMTLPVFEREFLGAKHIYFAMASLVFLVVVAVLRSYDPMTEINFGTWKLTHWFFNYESEFIKRGMVGEILRLMGVEVTRQVVLMLSDFLFAAVLLALLSVCCMWLVPGRKNTGLWLLAFVMLCSPATIQHFSFDIGRFDSIGLLLMLLSMFFIVKLSGFYKILAVTFIMSISILVHEAALLMYAPFVFVFWWYLGKDKCSVVRGIGVSLVILIGVTAIVYSAGSFTGMSFDEYYSYLNGKYEFLVSETALMVLYGTGLQDNLKLTAENGFTLKRLNQHLIFIAFVFLPLCYLLCRLYRVSKAFLTRRDNLLLLSAFSPLMLYPLAHDHFRWWSMAITNLFLAISILFFLNAGLRDQCAKLIFEDRRRVVSIIILSLIIGPLGATKSFSLKLVEKKFGLEAYPPLFVPGHPDYKPNTP